MARLLHEAAARGMAPEYVHRLLTAFPTAVLAQDSPPKTHSTGPKGTIARRRGGQYSPQYEIIEPLSERELEVLQLIAEGLTNPEIASRLFLSLNTVKVHTRNIYGKLNVHRRTQAVARARTLGILPSA